MFRSTFIQFVIWYLKLAKNSIFNDMFISDSIVEISRRTPDERIVQIDLKMVDEKFIFFHFMLMPVFL